MKTLRFYGLGGAKGWWPPITTERQRKAHALKHKKDENWAPYEIEWEVVQESCFRPRKSKDEDDEDYFEFEDCDDWDTETLASGEGEIRSIETSYEDLSEWVANSQHHYRDWSPSWGRSRQSKEPEYVGETKDREKVCARWDYDDWEGYSDESGYTDIQGAESLCISRAGSRRPEGGWRQDKLTKKEVEWFTNLLEGGDPGSKFQWAEGERAEAEKERREAAEERIEERIHDAARVRVGWELDGFAGRRSFSTRQPAACSTQYRLAVKLRKHCFKLQSRCCHGRGRLEPRLRDACFRLAHCEKALWNNAIPLSRHPRTCGQAEDWYRVAAQLARGAGWRLKTGGLCRR